MTDLPQIREKAFHNLTLAASFGRALTQGQGIALTLDCDARQVRAAQQELIAAWYLDVLACMANSAGHEHALHCVLSTAEREQLEAWNRTRVNYEGAQTLPELFEAQVERTPERVAVVFEGEELSYRELNRRANQVGHHLRRLGVGPEVRVGLCLERSLEMVVGLL